MKRREFLTATMSVTGMLLPRAGHTIGPCPPPQLSVSGGGSSTTSCDNSSPVWFANAPEGRWTEIAKSSEGKALSSVVESPVPRTSAGSYPEAPYGSGLINHFGGAVTNQARGEMLVVCCGGHGSYHGNDGYALSLREPDPRWYYLQESTPDNLILANPAPTGANSDGRFAAVHGWGRPCFGNGRCIWMYGDSAGHADAVTPYIWSWDREYPGIPTASPAAGGGPYLAHNGGAGPFTNHGLIAGRTSGNDAVGPAVYDRNNDTAYAFSGRDVPPRIWWRNFTSGASGSSVPETSGVYAFTTWAVHLHDLDVVLFGNIYGQVNGTSAYLAVWDKRTPNVYYKPTLSNGTGWGSSDQKAGAVYDAGNRKVYITHPPTYGANTIRVIDVPSDPRAGPYIQRTYSVPGNGVRWQGTTGTYGNFGLIEDMGQIGGVRRQALVYIGSYDDATFAMKLPVSGL